MTREEYHDAMSADAVALTNSIVTAMHRDPDGPKVRDLIASIFSDLTRGFDGNTIHEQEAELEHRCLRVTVMVEVMAKIVVQIIRAAEQAGVTVHLEALSSPYDVLTDLEEP